MVENNRIVKVRPDKDNLRSQGYVCRKGLNVGHFQHHRQRLEHPLKKQGSERVKMGWDQCLSEVADRLGALLDEHGPGSVALMAGGGGGCQIAGRFSGRFLFTLGSRYLYTSLGQEWTGRHYVRGRVYGNQSLFLHPDHGKLDLLLALGWNGWSSHGMPQTRRYLKSLSQDPKRLLIVVDPRPSETAHRADIHLPLAPGSDALLLKAMITIILDEGWQNQAFLDTHTSGLHALLSAFEGFPVREALEVCGLEFEAVREVCRLFAGRKSAVMSDLGVLMNRHSTLVSYLEEILLALCGRVGALGGNVFTASLSPFGFHTPPEDPETWRTTSSDIPAIMGVFPPNVLPEEITSGRPDRIRAVIVVGANPLRSYADTSAYEQAFKALELLVVVDVALSETAALADYILPGRTAFESYDATFWSFNYPEVFFQLRRPVLEPAPETRENGWIMTSLANKMGLVPEIPETLHQYSKNDRRRFSQELSRFVEATPMGLLKLPFILAKTLGPTLGSNHLAFLWGLLWSAPPMLKEAMDRLGLGKGEDQAEKAYMAIMDHPEGIWLGRLDPQRNLDFLATQDGRIQLHAPDLFDWLSSVTPAAEADMLAPDSEFPFVLMAGWHYDYNANTLMRDPVWNRGRRVGCLAVHPEDADRLGLADGDSARIITRADSVIVEVEISNLTREGMVILPQGFGLDFAGESVGVNVNRLTHAGHRDPIAATPYHRRVPCRLERL
jgi:anaerobic selenocysteine-containing dehydrogenase